GDADPCPLHPRPLAQLWKDSLDCLQRHRQATARVRPVKRGCHDHTDHLRLAVQQRGTRLARLNPRTDAHEVTAGHARETDPRREHFTSPTAGEAWPRMAWASSAGAAAARGESTAPPTASRSTSGRANIPGHRRTSI